jgi:AAA+ superfamily predicted ATPase
MAKELVLDEQITKDQAKIKEQISNAAVRTGDSLNNFYQVVLKELSSNTRNSQEQLNYLSVFEKAMSVFRETSLQLRTAMDTQTLAERLGVLEQELTEKTPKNRDADIARIRARVSGGETKEKDEPEEKTPEKTRRDALKEQITEAVSFSNRYALYFAGQVGLAMLDSEKAKDIEERFFFGKEYEAMQDNDILTRVVAETATNDLVRVIAKEKDKKTEITDAHLKYTLECIFTTWIDQFRWNTFKDIAQKQGIEDIVLKYDKFTTVKGEIVKKYDVVLIDPKFMNVKKVDLIGNEEYVAEVWSTGKKLLGWDQKTRRNPGNPPTAIITYGNPGGGKTFTAHALIQELGELARRRGVPLKAFPLSIADIGSKYQNESCNKLDAIIEAIIAHPGPVIMYVPDADTIIPSREGEASNEDVKLSGTFFSMLDGSRIPKGKFIFWGDMNYIDRLDEASKSRLLSARFLELKRFTKPEEFALYTRNYLTKNGDTVGIGDKEWLELGKYLLSTELSNREVANIINNITGSFEVPEELVGKPVADWDAARRAYTQSITMNRVITDCNEYIEKRMRIERESYENRFFGKIKKFKEDITKDPKREGLTDVDVGGR